MAIVEYRSEVSRKYYMRRTKSEIAARINMMRSQLKLEPLDERRITKLDKYNLASEALRMHAMLPVETTSD